MEMKEYIKLFLRHCPELAKSMAQSDHNYSSEFLNFWHCEGSVLTHTFLVAQQTEKFKLNDIVKISALLHDIGKPICEERNHERKRVNFIGHEGCSSFLSLTAIQKMNLRISHDELSQLVQLLSLHTILFRLMEKEDYIEVIKNKFKGNKTLLSNLIWLSKCDALGRFTDHENHIAENIEILLKPVLDNISDEKPECSKELSATVLCGPPLAGKTQWIKENVNLDTTIVISRDDIVLQMGDGKSYSESWNSIDQSLVEKEYQRQKKEAALSKKSIVFDLTNCSAKARRSCLSSLSPKEYNKKAVVLYTGYEELLQRNLARAASEGKYISPGVITAFVKSFTAPLYDEVDEITNIFNFNKK